jgi:predicted nucleic acid-binding protein
VNYILDTCVISEAVSRKPDPGVMAWLEAQDEPSLYLSCLTIGELTKGISRLPASARRHRLHAWVDSELPRRFGGRILDVDAGVAARWGALTGEAENRGEPLPVIDSLVAATALHHDLTVVTRNVADMRRCGAKVLNPWAGKVKDREQS